MKRSPESVKVLVGYECSGATRRAFRALGFDAWSCDTQAARDGSPNHHQCDIWELLERETDWDFAIFHPTCTYLTNSAAWAFGDPDFEKYPGVGYHQKIKPTTLTGAARRAAREEALGEVARLLALPFPKVVENPRGFIGTMLRPASQTIQPYDFGDDASKATCLWAAAGLEGEAPPLLKPTAYWPPRMVAGKPRWSNQTDSGQNRLSPGDNRADDRSETYPGVASALASQYGGWLLGRELRDNYRDQINDLLELLS